MNKICIKRDGETMYADKLSIGDTFLFPRKGYDIPKMEECRVESIKDGIYSLIGTKTKATASISMEDLLADNPHPIDKEILKTLICRIFK